MNKNFKLRSGIVSKQELLPALFSLINEIFLIKQISIEQELTLFIDKLSDNFYAFIEYPYVDKFYRNSYYNYFATKHRDYQKDCIRVSFFNKQFHYEDFRDPSKRNDLISDFLGFFILRPTLPNIIGRSIISPKLLKDHNFNCCLFKTEPLINGIKLPLVGFPYSSQDTESITCAETTIWVIMEYFSHKYPEYKPVLPSKIISTLSSFSFERQLPSHGLSADQISYTLKQFDFGVRLYSSNDYPNEMKSIFFDYIESGIPFIATIQNRNIGHAITVFGQEKFTVDTFETVPDDKIIRLNNGIEIVDCSLINRRYLAMDDNYPPYQLADFEDPTSYYSTNSLFRNSKITSIIVPLYHKIYLEAFQARNLAYFLCEVLPPALFPKRILLRLYLTSSRSYKNYISQDASIDISAKNEIIETNMPKFIWVAELSTKEHFCDNKAIGMIVLDATEANDYVLASLLFIAIKDKFIKFGSDGILYSAIQLNTINSFTNLTGV
jgi:hypothetical protein